MKKGTAASKVLIVTDTFPPEKVGSYRMHDLAVNLSRDGFNVTVLCPPPTFPFGNFKRSWKLVDAQYIKGVKVVRLWTWQPQSSTLSNLERLMYYSVMPFVASLWSTFSNDFNVIITSSGSTPLIWVPGLLQRVFFKKQWIIDERDLLIDGAISLGFLQKDSIITSMLKSFTYKCYLNGGFILVTTKSAQNGILSTQTDKNKVTIIPNAAETDIFYPMPLEKKKQIIYAGNIGHAQDFEPIMSAMHELSRHGIHLLMIGEGDLKQELKNRVSAIGLNDYITFLNGVDRSKLPPLLSKSIVGLAPLKNVDIIVGSIPAKIFDYMACGVPFVAFGGSDLKRIAAESGGGIVIENDPQKFAETILYLSNNPQIAEKMGKKGRAYCEQHYNRRLMAIKIKSLIQSLGAKN